MYLWVLRVLKSSRERRTVNDVQGVSEEGTVQFLVGGRDTHIVEEEPAPYEERRDIDGSLSHETLPEKPLTHLLA